RAGGGRRAGGRRGPGGAGRPERTGRAAAAAPRATSPRRPARPGSPTGRTRRSSPRGRASRPLSPARRSSPSRPWAGSTFSSTSRPTIVVPPVSDQEITCLIVDDHEVVREGLRLSLSRAERIRVIGEAADGESAVALVERRKPNVVIMDVRMPGMDGLEATKLLMERDPSTAVLI